MVGVGRRVGSRDKDIGLVTFSTRSQNNAWVTDALFVPDSDGSPDFSEYSFTAYELK